MKELCEICNEEPPIYVLRYILEHGKFKEQDVCFSCRESLEKNNVKFIEVDRI